MEGWQCPNSPLNLYDYANILADGVNCSRRLLAVWRHRCSRKSREQARSYNWDRQAQGASRPATLEVFF